MSDALWRQVDSYIDQSLLSHDAALELALQDSEAAGLPAIAVSPAQGKFLSILAQAIAARRILEIGTLGGYSSIWLARALPADGRLLSLEAAPLHVEVAQRNIVRAGLADKVEIRLGRALDLLPALADAGPFDLIFIDADKRHNPDYFAWALRLARLGSVIVVDNVIRGGAVLDDQSSDPDIVGTRRLYQALAAEPRVRASAIQTVGSKGYDGFAIALVVA
jgi:predicted O-methyltransferase YrrM